MAGVSSVKGRFILFNFNQDEAQALLDTSVLVESPSQDRLEQIIQDEERHPFYEDTVERAEVMQLFYNADKKDRATLQRIFKKSIIESGEDYESRLNRMNLLPVEKAMVNGVSRIYQGHHSVERRFPDSEGWKHVEKHYDDKGGSIEQFYREKVLVARQVLGFGAVVTDLLALPDGTVFEDDLGKPVPYSYILRPKEIWNFDQKQGVLSYLISHQKDGDTDVFKAFTKEVIYVWRRKKNDRELTPPQMIRNRFGEVPVRLFKGESDLDSGFGVGRPARWHVAGAYRALHELFYDLNEGSLLFAHPIPVLGEDFVKSLNGAMDSEGNIDHSVIQMQLGSVGIYPGNEPPKELFWQADMGGLQHLKSYFFELIRWIHTWSNVREKNQQVANTSGVSKAMDTVEERGMLANVAQSQEDLERSVLSLMAKVRGEEDLIDEDAILYQKEFDLTTPEETFKYLQEGMQYHALKPEVYEYLTLEFLRKVGASQDIIKRVRRQISQTGMPIEATYEAVKEIFEDKPEIAKRMFPELTGKYAFKDKLRDEIPVEGGQSQEPVQQDVFNENNQE